MISHKDVKQILTEGLFFNDKLDPERGKLPNKLPEFKLIATPIDKSAKQVLKNIKKYKVDIKNRKHKLGGNPDWIQSDETPICVDCKQTMPFYGQLDNMMTDGMYIGDSGMLYVFYCEYCGEAKVIVQMY